jgi:hypothetical protein
VNGQWVLQDPAEKIDGKSAGYPVQTSPEGYVNHVLVWADICAAVASAAATTQSVAPVTAAASVKEAGVKEVKETAKAPGPAANETASKPVPASAAPVKTEASTKPAPASAAPVKTEASIKPASASAAVAPTKPVQVAGNEKAVKPETATVKIADKTTSEEKSKGKSEKKRCTII